MVLIHCMNVVSSVYYSFSFNVAKYSCTENSNMAHCRPKRACFWRAFQLFSPLFTVLAMSVFILRILISLSMFWISSFVLSVWFWPAILLCKFKNMQLQDLLVTYDAVSVSVFYAAANVVFMRNFLWHTFVGNFFSLNTCLFNCYFELFWTLIIHHWGQSRATAGPGETFTRGPSGEKIDFFSF